MTLGESKDDLIRTVGCQRTAAQGDWHTGQDVRPDGAKAQKCFHVPATWHKVVLRASGRTFTLVRAASSTLRHSLHCACRERCMGRKRMGSDDGTNTLGMKMRICGVNVATGPCRRRHRAHIDGGYSHPQHGTMPLISVPKSATFVVPCRVRHPFAGVKS